MRSYSFSCLGLLVAGALACDSKSEGTSDTSDFATGTDSSGTDTDDGGTEGVSSTDVTGGPMTSGGSSNSGGSTSASTGATSTGGETTGGETETGTTTDADPTVSTSSTSIGTSMSSTITDTTGDPVEPSPCEGEAVVLDVAANAYLYSEQPPMPDPTGGSSGSSGGDPTDPDTVFVRLSNTVATCADPDPSLECGPNWEVSIRIPPSYQTPGLYHLLGPEVTGSMFETGADEGNNECSFGGGSFEATFELISIDDKSVTGRLCHVSSKFFDNKVDLEGSFEAPRCP